MLSDQELAIGYLEDKVNTTNRLLSLLIRVCLDGPLKVGETGDLALKELAEIEGEMD